MKLNNRCARLIQGVRKRFDEHPILRPLPTPARQPVLAAAIALAVTQERDRPGLVGSLEQHLQEADPSLLAASIAFSTAILRRTPRIPVSDLPRAIGLWVISKTPTTLPPNLTALDIGGACVRIAATWNIDREPSLLVPSLRTIAIEKLAFLGAIDPRFDDLAPETWEPPFVAATLVALLANEEADDLLTDDLASELVAIGQFMPLLLDDCAQFVRDFASAAARRKELTGLASALGTWVFAKLFDEPASASDIQAAEAIGLVAMEAADQV